VLDSFANKFRGIVLAFVVLLLSAVFALQFGGPQAEGCASGGQGGALAKVYGSKITQSEYQAAYMLAGGEGYSDDRAKENKLEQMVLYGLIERSLLARQAREVGFDVEDEAVLAKAAEDGVLHLSISVNAGPMLPRSGPQRFDFKDKDGKFLFHIVDGAGKPVPVWDWRRYYDVNVDEKLFEEYRRFSRFKHKDLAPYSEYVKARGLRWPVVQGADGAWRETRYRFVEGEDPYVKAGAGVSFYHSTSHDDRAQIWSHPYEPPPESPDNDFPFWLCTGRVIEHWHTGSMTMRIPPLRDAMPNAYVEMNREDARRLKIANGETVRLETRRGALELPVWLDGRGAPPRGSLFVPFFDQELLINELTLDAHDPISKQPDYKKCAVRVLKLGAKGTPA